jgi:hypothetical protein
LQGIDAYRRTTRAGAVRRAQSEGRYDELDDVRIAAGISRRREVQFRDASGRQGSAALDALGPADRMTLFTQGENGIEPLALWLTESGMPMPYRTWEAVFATANARCRSGGVPIHCHPHMLRHSSALRMLVTLFHAFDRRLGLTEEERREDRLIFGDPWVMVQTLLGHANLTTTRDHYLEPVTGLQVEMFLNGEEDGDGSVHDLLGRIAASSPRVLDVPEGTA